MPTPAELWQQRQRQVSAATAAAVVGEWARVNLVNPQRSFEAVLPRLLAAAVKGQLAAASGAEQYVGAVLAVDGLTPAPVASVSPRRFAGVTSDGRTMVGLLTQPLLRTLHLRTQGADDAVALQAGRLSLETLVRTEMLDTGRDAVSVAAGLEREVVGYVRQVHSPACGRCILLAGKFFKRNAGFDRHPMCDCSHDLVTQVRKPGEVDQEPRKLFDGMTSEQQDRAFGKVNAEVIRRGGDIGQVVNARRGMATAGSNWTTEGTTSRGAFGRSQGAARDRRPPRPSPGALLRFAENPDEFARALARAGYL